jgi:hypothetical protein
MAATFNITQDLTDMTRHLRGIEREVIPKASVRTINDVGNKARTQARKNLAKTMGVKQKRIKTALKTIRAKPARPVYEFQGTGKPIALIHFKGKALKSGVVASPFGKKKKYKAAFITPVPGGHKGIYKRKGRARLPIKEYWGPSVPVGMATDAVGKAWGDSIKVTFAPIMTRNIAFYLAKIAK